MKPLVSFCLPTYNRSEFLAEAIESCRNQTYPTIEIVIVNDGSTDSTESLLEWYAKTDPRIRFVTTPNQGIAAARNLAISLAKGDYIAVMDSDDLCGPDRLERQMKDILNGYDISYSSYLRADENGIVIDGVRAPKPKELTKESLLKDQGIPHVTITAKRNCFVDHPYSPEHTVNDDYRLVVEWVKAGYKMAVIEDPLMIVRFHEHNVSRTEWDKIQKINEEVRKEIRES